MDLIKPKFNIGDKVYFIYERRTYGNIFCELCKKHEMKTMTCEWKYDEQEYTINGINVNFNSGFIFYNLCFLGDEDDYFEYSEKEEKNIFVTISETIIECEKRNKATKE